MLSRFELIASGIDRTQHVIMPSAGASGFQPLKPRIGCGVLQLGTDRGLSQRRDVQAPRPGALRQFVGHIHVQPSHTHQCTHNDRFRAPAQQGLRRVLSPAADRETRCEGGLSRASPAYLHGIGGVKCAGIARPKAGVKTNPDQMRGPDFMQRPSPSRPRAQRLPRTVRARPSCPAFLDRSTAKSRRPPPAWVPAPIPCVV